MSGEHAAGLILSGDDWEWATQHLPIACVDLLPLKYERRGSGVLVGLILRDSPFGGPRWCHLGGRVFYGESLLDAAERHLRDSLDVAGLAQISREPYFVNQFFPDDRPGMGWDPRKHAVAACFSVRVPEGEDPVATGNEALEFKWFTREALPPDQELWPGTKSMIEHPGALGVGRDVGLSYQALNDRYISHNELMWQTPVLAMTAMAFLLTIALGQSEDWMRALAAGLSALIALVSSQLMAKHSHSQIEDSENLYQLELRLGMLPVHSPPQDARVSFSLRHLPEWFSSKKSRLWWFRALLLFAVVSALVCVQALVAAVR